VFSHAETFKLVELAERYDLFLIIDEAYKDLSLIKKRTFPAQLAAACSRIVRVYTFKAYGMTGWRGLSALRRVQRA
jgi:aspartate/methionine/tyrosine aminotransferase